jgi:hypothetical protein
MILALLFAGPAAAGPALTGSGTGTLTRVDIVVIREAGGNVIQERTLEGTVEGALTGTFVEQVRGVIHKSGLVTFQGTLEFTGTVAGCGDGTLTAGLTGRAQSGLPTSDASIQLINAADSTLAVTGTGGLQQVGLAVTYDVRYICH